MLLNRQIGFGLMIGLLFAMYENSLVENKNAKIKEGKTMTKKELTKKELNEEQLNNVSGGTVKELEELANAVYPGEEYARPVYLGTTHVPVGNIVIASELAEDLEKVWGIEAHFNLGFCGTGIASVNNTYIDKTTGDYISHSDVVARIKNTLQVG